jgi:hypothetical protein
MVFHVLRQQQLHVWWLFATFHLAMLENGATDEVAKECARSACQALGMYVFYEWLGAWAHTETGECTPYCIEHAKELKYRVEYITIPERMRRLQLAHGLLKGTCDTFQELHTSSLNVPVATSVHTWLQQGTDSESLVQDLVFIDYSSS